MAKLAIAMLVGFAVLTLGVRVAVQLRRTGSTGLIGVGEGVSRIAWIGGASFIAGNLLGGAAPILALTDVIEPIEALDRTGFHVAGIALAGAGILGVFAAQMAMGASWRIGVDEGERTELITGGVFGLCRNPIYTAMIATWVGFALMVPSPVAFAALAMVLIGLEIQVRLVEEPHLVRAHGEPYRAYAGRVGRFLPGVGRGVA